MESNMESNTEKRKLYLAYGSNLNVPQMLYRCPEAQLFGTAEIVDYQLLFKGSKTGAYLTIERKAGSRVPVGVWSVTEHDEAALDRYEGFPTFYYRREMTVTVKNEKTGKPRRRRAFVYIMHEERALCLPSHAYMETCKAGYQAFGFDQRFLREAIRASGGEVTA